MLAFFPLPYKKKQNCQIHHFIRVSVCMSVCYMSVQVAVLEYIYPEVIWLIQLKCPVVILYSLHYCLDKSLSLNWKPEIEQSFRGFLYCTPCIQY